MHDVYQPIKVQLLHPNIYVVILKSQRFNCFMFYDLQSVLLFIFFTGVLILKNLKYINAALFRMIREVELRTLRSMLRITYISLIYTNVNKRCPVLSLCLKNSICLLYLHIFAYLYRLVFTTCRKLTNAHLKCFSARKTRFCLHRLIGIFNIYSTFLSEDDNRNSI